jgi:dihydrofolate reductase
MGKVVTGFSTSLDGFIAGPGDDVQHVFKWYFSGDTEFKFPSGMAMKVSPASAAVLGERVRTAGALVTGRRQFDNMHGWGGRHPVDVPVFVLTHHPPADWVSKEGSPFTFVSEGVESAIAQAQAVAGDKDVIVDGANVVQQAIRAGLVDEIGIDLIPVLLGQGVRYFDHLSGHPLALEKVDLVDAPGVTHMRFRVKK